MINAFIFDMDGVIVDSERGWQNNESDFLEKTLGVEMTQKIGSPTGLSIRTIYDMAYSFGFKMSFDQFLNLYDSVAIKIYEQSPITPDLDLLIKFLLENEIVIGLVSSSPEAWIQGVLKRTTFADKLKCIVSLNGTHLKGKPAPDGYIYAMGELNSNPATTVILEDSNPGIESAKASGAYVIGFTQNLIPGYKQKGADIYGENMLQVIDIVINRHS